MADNPWLTPIGPIDTAPDAPVGTPLALPAPTIDPWQTPIGAVSPPPEMYGPPGPAVPYDALNAAVHGFTGGLDEPVRSALIAGAYKLGGTTQDFNYPEAAAEVKAGRQAYEAAHPYLNAGANLAGSLVGPGGLTGRAMTEAGPLARIGISGATGAGLGGIQGAAENTTSLDEMLQGAKTGAEWGGAIGTAVPAFGAIGSAAFPRLSQAAQTLRAAGVQPTPGTIGGLPGIAENVMSHIPFVGGPINAGRAAAQQQLQDTLANLGPARNAAGQFISGPSPARATVLQAGNILPAPASGGHTLVNTAGAGALGAGVGLGLVEHGPEFFRQAMEHPLGTAATALGATLGYPLLKGIYSSPGRWATTGLLGHVGSALDTAGRLGPVGAQVAPGLLSYYNPNAKP